MANQRLTVFLELRKQPGWYGKVTVAKATNKKPRVTHEDSVVVKLAISIDTAVFDPISPSVEVNIPADLVDRSRLTVTAEQAGT
jgi:hypothetical protein